MRQTPVSIVIMNEEKVTDLLLCSREAIKSAIMFIGNEQLHHNSIPIVHTIVHTHTPTHTHTHTHTHNI